ncbi:MAG TPA: recombination mediator RecR [Terriglobales bacterium]|nr:recombination mediator RecR [Terriglobales bacterium]
MSDLAAPLERLIDELKRLPGIGQKSAQRIAFHLMRGDRERAQNLAEAVLGVKDSLRLCGVCNNITDVDPCQFCASPHRNPTLICVVEQPNDILAVEKTRQFNGLYHVLHGSLSPLAGIGPDQIRIKSLIERLRATRSDGRPVVEEIILATDPDAEGEATAVYLARLLKPLGVRASRIAMGIPVGSEIDYADEVTMLKALEGRRAL